jgi:hypothetical protein
MPDQGICTESTAYPGLCVCDNGAEAVGTGQCAAEGELGCVDPGLPCCDGLTCCGGVPYDMAGECWDGCPMVSDRNKKTGFGSVDPDQILEGVAHLPIGTWSYRADPEARHIGPMAQDFASTFGMGSSDQVIEPVDASGVALAAIQALYQRVDQLARQNEALRRRVEAVKGCEQAGTRH